MNPVDFTILRFVNQFSQASSFFDNAVSTFQENNLLKAGALMPVFWYFWFRRGNEIQQRTVRARLIVTIMAGIAALAVARGLATCLPFRVRPMYIKELAFKLPHGSDESFFVSWSSFPSDHAALLCSLAAGLLFVSRKVGALCYAYVFFFICVMRIYMGIHYPTDILVGAGIGTAMAVAFNTDHLRNRLSTPAFWLMDKNPGLFYAGFFLLTYQLSDLFNAVRAAAKALFHAF